MNFGRGIDKTSRVQLGDPLGKVESWVNLSLGRCVGFARQTDEGKALQAEGLP